MPKFTIDGRTLDVPAGQTILVAALNAGIDIPYYCWHPKLSIAANCRMCLVDVEKAPKMPPACQTVVAEGMVVHSANAKVLEFRKSNLEFILVNHPVDCPWCDQAGECKLQEYYMKHDLMASRLKEPKVRKRKIVQIGPEVTLDEERCILCTRCVRFCDEVVGQKEQLGVFGRGAHSYIGTYPGKKLDNAYSVNTVDICPVGALTSTDFRFKQRVWFLKSTQTVCPGCARGCNVTLDQNKGVAYRMRPRENEAVNQVWMCDPGRKEYKRINDERVTFAAVRRDDALQEETSVAEALLTAAALMRTHAGKIGLVVSPWLTVEDLLALKALADRVRPLRTYLGGRADGPEDALLMRADKNPNRAGVTEVFGALPGVEALEKDLRAGTLGLVVFAGTELALPLERQDDLLGAVPAVALASNRDPIADDAAVLLPAAAWGEKSGTVVNFQGARQQLAAAFAPRGDALPEGVLCAQLGELLADPAAHRAQAAAV